MYVEFVDFVNCTVEVSGPMAFFESDKDVLLKAYSQDMAASQCLASHIKQIRDQMLPGVLVLINDCDWELEGTLACALRDGDVVAFISTLHGG